MFQRARQVMHLLHSTATTLQQNTPLFQSSAAKICCNWLNNTELLSANNYFVRSAPVALCAGPLNLRMNPCPNRSSKTPASNAIFSWQVVERARLLPLARHDDTRKRAPRGVGWHRVLEWEDRLPLGATRSPAIPLDRDNALLIGIYALAMGE
jgi:hypothetical protein